MLSVFCLRLNGRERWLAAWFIVCWMTLWLLPDALFTHLLFGRTRFHIDQYAKFPWFIVVLAIGAWPSALSNSRSSGKVVLVALLCVFDAAMFVTCRQWLWPLLTDAISSTSQWRFWLGFDLGGLMLRTYVFPTMAVGLSVAGPYLVGDDSSQKGRFWTSVVILLAILLLPPLLIACVVLLGLVTDPGDKDSRIWKRFVWVWPLLVTMYAIAHHSWPIMGAILALMILGILVISTKNRAKPTATTVRPSATNHPRAESRPQRPEPLVEWETHPIRHVHVVDHQAREAMIQQLLAGTRHTSSPVRLQSVSALGQLGLERSFERLTEIAKHDANIHVRVAAVQALQSSSLVCAKQALAALQEDPQPAVRWLIADPELLARDRRQPSHPPQERVSARPQHLVEWLR